MNHPKDASETISYEGHHLRNNPRHYASDASRNTTRTPDTREPLNNTTRDTLEEASFKGRRPNDTTETT